MIALVVLLLAAGPQPESAAEQAFREGRRLLQEGKIADACAAFEQSQKLDPALGTLLNLADCEGLLGHDAKAYGLWQEVLGWSRRAKHAEREQVALQKLGALRGKVALVVVDAPPEAKTEVDGQPVVAGTQVPLAPGTHDVVVTVGDEVRRQRLEVKAGELVAAKPEVAPKVVVIAPEPAPEPEAAPVIVAPPPAAEAPKRTSRVGVGLIAGGAAVLIAGVVGTAWAYGTWQQVERQRPGGPDYDRPTVTESEYRRAAVAYPVSLTAIGVGVAAAAGGAALVVGGSF
jgi:hypothetical protein